ncbi:type II toxin-antitoxin system VapC family toxin [Amycolatopsis sp. lyj-109]|uniref:type II toxin-antitoxin system VapC family toxin n=1 Tax=Amycolatopsis sp. lyj-109 TaxID=2789287 RepID=UPI00397BD80F
MIIDSSAIIAMINHEPETMALERALVTDLEPKIGAPTKAEAGIVLQSKFGMRGRSLFERFLQEWGVVTLPFDDRHAEVAIEAFQRFGKGRHSAKLNLGDCHSYATAKLAREPLLCIGNDFPQTDLELVKLES